MKEDKELIDEIIDRLKTTKDFAYREGAWERFKEMDGATVPTRKISSLNKYVAVAAMLLMGLLVSYFVFKSKQNIVDDIGNADEKLFVERTPYQNKTTDKNDAYPSSPIMEHETSIKIKEWNQENKNVTSIPYLASMEGSYNIASSGHIDMLPTMAKVVVDNSIKSVEAEVSNPESTQTLLDHLVLANSNLANQMISSANPENVLKPKSFKYGDRFDLGIYVSPYSSAADNLKVGAGFTLAYNITKNISVRTGASYNTYEVGIMKDPMAAGSVEKVNAKVNNSIQNSNDARGSFMQASKIAVPNVNAITGFVRSIEIPLEVKYNMNKTLYATAGVSYSTIINQERNAQYVENVNFNTFSNGFPDSEAEASNALKAVTKTVKSAEKNVNTNGYTGFVNFSVGKKVNLNQKFGVSVEPFVKIPVGEFRRADMNYTNGGIRIMTNF